MKKAVAASEPPEKSEKNNYIHLALFTNWWKAEAGEEEAELEGE